MISTESIRLESKGHGDIADITSNVAEKVAGSGIKNGTVCVFVAGSTAGITTIEYEPGLVADLSEMWQRLAPDNIPYHHDQRWGDGNGYAHVRASLLGASLVVPIKDTELMLGTWQQIILVDFDNHPRTRQVIIQITGE